MISGQSQSSITKCFSEISQEREEMMNKELQICLEMESNSPETSEFQMSQEHFYKDACKSMNTRDGTGNKFSEVLSLSKIKDNNNKLLNKRKKS